MTKFFFLLTSLLILNVSFAAFSKKKVEDSVAVEAKQYKAEVQVEPVKDLSVEEFQRLAGRKLNWIERLAFKVEKKHFVKELKKNEEPGSFSWAGFTLGLLLGPYGMLAALIFSRNRNFKRSAWLGFRIWLAIFFIILFVLLAKAGGKLR